MPALPHSLPDIHLFQTIAVLFHGNDSIPQSLLNDAFKGLFFYSFHLKHFFFFLPWRGKEEKGKLIKQSPNAEHLALSLWLLTVALAPIGWGLPLRRSGGEQSSQGFA